MSKYDVYENGYQNGICFGYIPDLNEDEMRIWSIGYKDAKVCKKRKSLDEINSI